MTVLELMLVAVGLSMDAFAVSIGNALSYKCEKKQFLLTAFMFGLFQALMPVLGFYGGRLLGSFIQTYDHWVALILLGFIGGKMIIDGIKDARSPEKREEERCLSFRMLLLQAVATSIDALAVGISFAALSVKIYLAAPVIGLTTFGFSVIGSFIGKKAGAILKNAAEITGGAILVLIGVKIFIEHFFSA